MACTSVGLLVEMILESDPITVSYLSENECSNDDILNKSFVSIDEYFKSIQVKNFVTVALLGLVIVIDIFLFMANTWSRY